MFHINTGRPPTLAPNGMVSSPHSLASAAGVDVLRAGGSAVDAAIAASAVLAVVYPHMTGVGGDAFWLIYDAAERRVRYLDGGGRAVRSAGINWFAERGLADVPPRGVLPATLTVPGAVASWGAAHQRHGRVPLARDLAAAQEYARDGFPVTARLAGFIEDCAAQRVFNTDAARIFLPDGNPPRAGARLVNPGLASVLSDIAGGGARAYYEGAPAEALAAFARAEGGFFDAADLAAKQAHWSEPISGMYRGVRIFETPAPTQGFTVLQMLNLLEPLDIGRLDPRGADLVHWMVQAKQIAYCDRDALLADPAFCPFPAERLISKGYAAERSRLMRADRTLSWDEVPSYGSLAGDTVYVCAVDREGNAASLIMSLYFVFGSGVVAGDTGIVLQNRSAYFSLDPQHPNRLEAGKVPLHTLIASLALREDGTLWQVLGCMGADGQPQIQLQTYVGLIDFGLDIQQALEAPRWLSGRFALGDPRDLLNMEGRFLPGTLAELERRGHRVNRWPDWMELAGHAHGITLDPQSGMRVGGADPRSDGAAIGY